MRPISTKRGMIAAAAATAVAIGTLATAGPASAFLTSTGWLCKAATIPANSPAKSWNMLALGNDKVIYGVAPGEWVRIDGIYNGAQYYGYYLAHTSGHTSGRFWSGHIDESTCHM